MTNLQAKVLNLVKQNKSVNQITEELNISNKQLLKLLQGLKDNGYSNYKKYWGSGFVETGTGFISYQPKAKEIMLGNNTNINTLVIADTHLGSKLDRVDLLNKVYDYAIKNNIHIIIHLGDLVDGYKFNSKLSRNKSAETQMKYLLKNYPFDKNILNFILLGNHDHYVASQGINMVDFLNGNRLDLIPVGLGNGSLIIKNEKIFLYHQISYNNDLNDYLNPNSKIILTGHHHEYSTNLKAGNVFVSIPSVSDICIQKDKLEKGMVEMDLHFSNDNVDEVLFKHFVLEPKVINCGEIELTFPKLIKK